MCRLEIALGGFGDALEMLWEALGRLWEALGGFGEALGGFGDALEGFGEALGGCAETLGKLRGGIEENLGGFGEAFRAILLLTPSLPPLYIKKINSRSTALAAPYYIYIINLI